MKNIPEEDRQILLQTISKCYLKYQDSIIKDNGNSIKCQTANGVNNRSKDTV